MRSPRPAPFCCVAINQPPSCPGLQPTVWLTLYKGFGTPASPRPLLATCGGLATTTAPPCLALCGGDPRSSPRTAVCGRAHALLITTTLALCIPHAPAESGPGSECHNYSCMCGAKSHHTASQCTQGASPRPEPPGTTASRLAPLAPPFLLPSFCKHTKPKKYRHPASFTAGADSTPGASGLVPSCRHRACFAGCAP